MLQFKPKNQLHQCIAKTLSGNRCRRSPIHDSSFCQQHTKMIKKYMSLFQKMKNQMGGNLLSPLMPFVLPSCIDVLKCDWITDINSAIPGLSSILKLG